MFCNEYNKNNWSRSTRKYFMFAVISPGKQTNNASLAGMFIIPKSNRNGDREQIINEIIMKPKLIFFRFGQFYWFQSNHSLLVYWYTYNVFMDLSARIWLLNASPACHKTKFNGIYGIVAAAPFIAVRLKRDAFMRMRKWAIVSRFVEIISDRESMRHRSLRFPWMKLAKRKCLASIHTITTSTVHHSREEKSFTWADGERRYMKTEIVIRA